MRILLFTFLLAFSSHLYSQETKDYKLTDKAYGLAWDGINFWFIDTNRRALIKINEIGEQEIYNLGLANLRGISYDQREGRLLVVAPKMIMKVDPNTGGITDRISIPVQNVAGVASVGNFYYILDLENAKVQIFDKVSSIMVGGFFTDRTRPRDICYGRDSLWISDSADNSIYRYDTKSGKITGSIKTSLRSIRGILLSGSKIWVVDRESHEIKNIPFIETERFIASGDEEYTLEVSLKFKIDTVSISKAQIAIAHPPSNEGQRIRSVKFTDATYKPAFIQRNRVHLKKMTIEDSPGEQVVKYKFTSRNQFIKYYVGDEYLNREASYPPDTSYFFDKTKENPKLFLSDYLNTIKNERTTSQSLDQFRDRMNELAIPSIPYRMIRFENKKPKSIEDAVMLFLLGYGWVPVGDLSIAASADHRYFEKKETDLILYQSFSKTPAVSPVYFKKDPSSEWENLPAEITYKIK
ncbi:hypothetical protein LPTSP4_28340 [Leptospira ryugenii]|uniref:6-bladed beta-propeller n=1 Tax=Leptospira ryugenii TaxID=1917863 RepID=A0A2P2E330_9LEPT|nr:hypothetical protein [Leptospira ryugenii]GBF51302.1 hypothetical protein LPTSP4_28340 [Leptospira ryugenii]